MKWRRLLGAVIATAALAGVTLCAPPARADNPGVQLTLTAVTPRVWTPGAVAQVQGSVTNATPTALVGARVVLWQSTTSITTLTSFDAALVAPPTTREPGETITASNQLLGGATGLGAGASVAFSVSGNPTLPSGGASLVGIQVLSRGGVVLARARVMIACPSPSAPGQGSLVVPLTTQPSLVAAGTPTTPALFRDDHLATDLDGSLGDLLALAESPGATPLIDPALVDDLTQMAAGYQVGDGFNTPVAGVGQAAAQAALTRLDALIAGGHCYRLPFGDPDMAVLATLPGAPQIAALTTATGNALASLPLAVMALGPGVTATTRQFVESLAPSVVVSDAVAPAATLQAAGGVPWVALTPPAALIDLSGPPPDFAGASAVQAPAARLARFAVAVAQGAPTVVLAGDATTATTVTAWLAEGWTPQPLAQVLAGLTPAPFTAPVGPAVSPVPPDLAAALATTTANIATWTDLGDAPDPARALAQRLLPAALSAEWGGDWASSLAWLQQASAGVNAQVSGGVELRLASSWHLSSSTNPMPVSIVNHTGMPVTVRVAFASENAARLGVPASDLVTVAAGDTQVLTVTPQAAGNGSVAVSAQLVTANGTPVGAAASVQVVVTAAGRLGWLIILASGLAFVVATTMRVRQVRRQRAIPDIKSDVPESN